MASSRKAVFLTALVVLGLIAVGGYAWFGRGRPKNDGAEVAAKAKQFRDTGEAEIQVDFEELGRGRPRKRSARPSRPRAANLATAGMHEPLRQNWTIERLLAIRGLDLKRNRAATTRRSNEPKPLSTWKWPSSPKRPSDTTWLPSWGRPATPPSCVSSSSTSRPECLQATPHNGANSIRLRPVRARRLTGPTAREPSSRSSRWFPTICTPNSSGWGSKPAPKTRRSPTP